MDSPRAPAGQPHGDGEAVHGQRRRDPQDKYERHGARSEGRHYSRKPGDTYRSGTCPLPPCYNSGFGIAHGDHREHHPSRRPGPQHQGRRPGHPPEQAHRRHRGQRLGQVLPGLRHSLRRGPAPLHRVPLLLRPPVPRADGQARRRPHRGHPAGHRHPAEGRGQEPPLDRGHGHRDLRFPPRALRPHRHRPLPPVRPARRPRHDRRHRRRALLASPPGRSAFVTFSWPREQGPGLAQEGRLHPGRRRRRGRRSRSRAQSTRRRGRSRRPDHPRGRRAGAAGRLARDGPQEGRRPGLASGPRTGREHPLLRQARVHAPAGCPTRTPTPTCSPSTARTGPAPSATASATWPSSTRTRSSPTARRAWSRARSSPGRSPCPRACRRRCWPRPGAARSRPTSPSATSSPRTSASSSTAATATTASRASSTGSNPRNTRSRSGSCSAATGSTSPARPAPRPASTPGPWASGSRA